MPVLNGWTLALNVVPAWLAWAHARRDRRPALGYTLPGLLLGWPGLGLIWLDTARRRRKERHEWTIDPGDEGEVWNERELRWRDAWLRLWLLNAGVLLVVLQAFLLLAVPAFDDYYRNHCLRVPEPTRPLLWLASAGPWPGCLVLCGAALALSPGGARRVRLLGRARLPMVGELVCQAHTQGRLERAFEVLVREERERLDVWRWQVLALLAMPLLALPVVGLAWALLLPFGFG
ncbi:MAG: hypothetical protein AB1758_28860 [Candidatus Eremiobacterota bacterium]